jgi:NAD(P)-dependent dehydrogenase (short-subunit alcohol dehydrogenase family)
MRKNLVVVGFGPGISKAVAERFGREGFSVALVGRNVERLEAGVKELATKDVRAHAVRGDVGTVEGARETMKKAHAALGSIAVLHWNAYGMGGGDLTTAPLPDVRAVLEVATVNFIAALQEALPDLRAEKGAVLTTNGGLGALDPTTDASAVQYGAMGLALANAAKHKLVRLLHHKLKPEGVYVGEVMVSATVKGTAWDRGGGPTIEGSVVGAKFWDVFQARKDFSTRL